MEKYPFRKQLAIGKQGEDALVSLWLAEQRAVEDVRGDKNYQRRDIDFIVDDFFVEVKTGAQKHPNVFIETQQYGKPGAVFTSRAELWVYYFPLLGVVYTFRLSELQCWLWEHAAEYPVKMVAGGKAYGVCVPHTVFSKLPFVEVTPYEQKQDPWHRDGAEGSTEGEGGGA